MGRTIMVSPFHHDRYGNCGILMIQFSVQDSPPQLIDVPFQPAAPSTGDHTPLPSELSANSTATQCDGCLVTRNFTRYPFSLALSRVVFSSKKRRLPHMHLFCSFSSPSASRWTMGECDAFEISNFRDNDALINQSTALFAPIGGVEEWSIKIIARHCF